MPIMEATVPTPRRRIVRAATVETRELLTAEAVAVAGTAPEDRTADIAEPIRIDHKDQRRSARAAFFLVKKAYRGRYPLHNRS